MDEIWKELKEKDEITNCEGCGRKIWIYWHTDSNIINGGMKRCGPCHSGRVQMVVEETNRFIEKCIDLRG